MNGEPLQRFKSSGIGGNKMPFVFQALGIKRSATPLLHQRLPVGRGPSLNICP
jgi:hypothetical protein